MQKPLLLLSLLAVVACASPRDYRQETEQVANYGVSTWTNGLVTCFVYRDADSNSMSCLPNQSFRMRK